MAAHDNAFTKARKGIQPDDDANSITTISGPLEMWWRGAAVIAMVVLVGACSGEASEPSSIVLEPAARVTVSDLDTTVRVASAGLLDLAGIEIVQVEEVDGVVASRLWMDFRPRSGEFVRIESVDNLVRSRGRDEDGGVLTSAAVLVGDSLFQAATGSAEMPQVASTPWQAKRADPERPDDAVPMFIDLRGMAAGEYTSDQTALDSYRRDTSSGGTEWILVSSFREGTMAQRWLVDAAGNLDTYSVVFEGVGPALDEPRGLPSKVRVMFTPVAEPEPIAEPTVGEPLELDNGSIP